MTAPPEFIARLHPNPALAQIVAFGVLVRIVAESRGMIRPLLAPVAPITSARHLASDIQTAFAELDGQNSHLHCGGLDDVTADVLDPDACAGFIAWVTAQRLDREPPLVAYELGILALGAELPGVILRSLREVVVAPEMTVVETPDGGGYATLFLASMHQSWIGQSVIGVSTDNAERLAGFAHVLRTGNLTPTSGVVRIKDSVDALRARTPSDGLLLIYNPPEWLGTPAVIRASFDVQGAILV